MGAFYEPRPFFLSDMKNWYSNSTPEYRNPNWQRNDWFNGGTVERHEDTYGRTEYVRRDWIGDVTARTKPDWNDNWGDD